MSAFIRDIKERGTGTAKHPAPPQPPSFDTSSTGGFPNIPHRSQRISAFKRARNESKNGTAPSSSTGYPIAPPVVRSTLAPKSPPKPSVSPLGTGPGEGNANDVEGILASVQDENMDRVQRMTDSQREEELQELEMQIPREMLERMKLALEKRRAKAEEEEKDLESEGEDASELPEEGQEQEGAPAAAAKPRVSFKPLVSVNPSEPPKARIPTAPPSSDATNFPSPADSTQQIHDRYFPNETLQQPALEWIQKPLTSEDVEVSKAGGAARFDLSGNVLSEEDAKDLPVTLGLHHHGEEAGKAGYTVAEVLVLSTSTYGPQRTMMMGLLSKIVGKLGKLDQGEDLGMGRQEFKGKAFLTGCGVLGSKEKNVGMLREAIACLEVALRTSSGEDIVQLTKLVDISLVLARMEDLLSEPIKFSRLSAPSIVHLVSSLRHLAASSASLSRAIVPQVPQLLDNFVLALQWPDLGKNAQVSWEIALLCLLAVKECTEQHRDLARTLANKNVYDSLIRFLALPPWVTKTAEESYEGYQYELVIMIFQLLEKVTRYGLRGKLVTSSGNIFMDVGSWVRRLSKDELQASDMLARIVSAYLALTRIWTIAAVNPHNMVNDHELIWSHVEGYMWVDEALHCLRAAWEPAKASTKTSLLELGKSSLDVLSAWMEGATINTVDANQRWGQEIRQAIGELDVVVWVTNQLAGTGSEPLSFGLVDSALKLLLQLKLWLPTSWTSSSLYSLSTSFELSEARSIACSFLLYGDRKDVDLWAKISSAYLLAIQPGEEQDGLQVLDVLVDLDWKDDVQRQITHRHGLYILRPFYHYLVLPSLDTVVSPHYPLGKLLKATTSLKAQDRLPTSKAGLPLNPDWMLSPLDEQLRPETSQAFKQVPPAWDASPSELAQATMAMYQLLASHGSVSISRSALLLHLMKVFMLELGVDPEWRETEIFRDKAVSAQLSEIMAGLLMPSSDNSTSTTLETASQSFLPAGTLFFQFYSDFHELYESISFSDVVFGQLLLPALAQSYPIDYRRLFWCEQTGALRTLRVRFDQVPLEHGSLREYFRPAELDPQLLSGHLSALSKGFVGPATHPFLYALAVWHVANATWSESPALQPKQVLSALGSAGKMGVWEDILGCNCAGSREEFSLSGSTITEAEKAARLAVVA